MNRQNVYAQLKIDEGVKLEVYRDHLGNPTVGVGHLITPVDHLGLGDHITEERCEALFQHDLDTAITECQKLLPAFDTMHEEVQEVLVNMMFNLGPGGLAGFKQFLAALRDEDFSHAADEMQDSRWYHQVGDRSKRLEARIRALA